MTGTKESFPLSNLLTVVEPFLVHASSSEVRSGDWIMGPFSSPLSLACLNPSSRLGHFTSIRRGFASSALGRTRVITPSRISALIFSWSTLLEMRKLRRKGPILYSL
jgi:hypothetical protein